MNKIKISDYIADFFSVNGLDRCYMVTGGGAMHLNDSIGHHQNIKVIYNHHEQACAMAAEGFARISGKPAIVCVTSGPGSTNAITGVLGGWLDSLPMFVISGQMKYETTIKSTPIPLRQLGFQEFNIVDSISCMTKYAVMITDPIYIAYHLEKALYMACNGRMGPVWIDIPLDIQAATVSIDEMIHYNFGAGQYENVYLNNINDSLIKQVIDKINEAIKPVLMVGYGIRMSGAYDEFLRVVDKLQIPVVTEWNSHDLLGDEHEFNCGRPGTVGNRGGNFVVQSCDLLLAVGCQFSIRQISYEWENFAKQAYIIAVDPDKNELIKPTIKVDMPINVAIVDFLNALSKSKVVSTHSKKAKWYEWCRAINFKYPVYEKGKRTNMNFLSVYEFLELLSDVLKYNDVVVLANGAACVCGLQGLRIKQGQRVFTNAGASSMGYGITAAIGVATANSNIERTICIEGDGSIQMNLQELQTIVHNRLNIKIFWINNSGYHSIKQTQQSMFDAKNRGYCGADNESGLSFPSAEKISKAYGIAYKMIDKNANNVSILHEVLNSNDPVICEVVTDPNEEFTPKLKSKLLVDGKFHTPSLEDMYPFIDETEMGINKFRG
jgi:acetolactate synthase I/II/III large subunit